MVSLDHNSDWSKHNLSAAKQERAEITKKQLNAQDDFPSLTPVMSVRSNILWALETPDNRATIPSELQRGEGVIPAIYHDALMEELGQSACTKHPDSELPTETQAMKSAIASLSRKIGSLARKIASHLGAFLR